MQYTQLGKSDLTVSRICMGCMGFGDPSTGQHSWTLGEQESRDIIRYGLEQGINFLILPLLIKMDQVSVMWVKRCAI